MRTPSASSTSADPHRDDTARLPCLAIGTPAAAATSAAEVEMLNVSAPSPPVPQVSTSPSRLGIAGRRVGAHRPGAAGDLVGCLALHPQRHHERGDLGRAGVAAHHLHHGRVGLLAGEVAAVHQLFDRLSDHGCSIARKFAIRTRPCGVSTDSG